MIVKVKCSLCSEPATDKCTVCGELFCSQHKASHVFMFDSFETIKPEWVHAASPLGTEKEEIKLPAKEETKPDDN